MAASRGSLKLDRSLLNPKFEGYKLSLDPLPIYEFAITQDVLQVMPDDSQYSLQHVKLFNLHNYLYLDPWNFKCLYYIDTNRSVVKVRFDEHRRFEEPVVVFQFAQTSECSLRFNPSILFVSSSQTLISDGTGTMYLLETGDRLNTRQWKVVYKSSSDDFKLPFVLLHGIARSDGKISALLLSVMEQKVLTDSSASNTDSSSGPFMTVITWIDLALDEFHVWSIFRSRKLVGKGTLEYVSLCPEKDSVYIASNRLYKFMFDSLQPIEHADVQNEGKKKDKPASLYAWTQSEEDITVNFKLPKEVKKQDISILFALSTLTLVVNNRTLSLRGNLYEKIDASGCTWTLENDTLEIFLSKLEKGVLWENLIVGDTHGEEIVDFALKEEILSQLEYLTTGNSMLIDNKPPFNSQELEECDAYPMDYIAMYLIDGESHEVAEHVNLSANQWLFNTTLSAEQTKAFCIRHDVDGILWQPTSDGYEHKMTFNALGYVQASKQERKFSGCSPDGSFAVISDIRKHIYVYHQPNHLESSVRNRRTGQEINSVAHQRVVSLESSNDILGIQISNENIYVLTKNVLYVVRVRIG